MSHVRDCLFTTLVAIPAYLEAVFCMLNLRTCHDVLTRNPFILQTMNMHGNNIYDGCVLFKLAVFCECNVGCLFVHKYNTENSVLLATCLHAGFLVYS